MQIIEIFSLPFMERALMTLVVLAIASGVIGLCISFRELEFVSDGLVHAVFPGLVAGLALGGTAGILPGAIVAAVAAAVLFTLLERAGGIGADAAIAVALTGLFSVGVVLVSRQEGYVSQLQELLFGRLLTVTAVQFSQILVVALVAIVIVVVTWRAQMFRAFDPDGFVASGFRTLSTDMWLGISVALLVVAGVQALGVLMVVALLTVPMAAARLVSRRFVLLIPIAILVPFLAGFFGLWGSFVWSVRADVSVSPGAIVVLLLVGMYLAAAVFRLALLRRTASSRSQPVAAGSAVAA